MMDDFIAAYSAEEVRLESEAERRREKTQQRRVKDAARLNGRRKQAVEALRAGVRG